MRPRRPWHQPLPEDRAGHRVRCRSELGKAGVEQLLASIGPWAIAAMAMALRDTVAANAASSPGLCLGPPWTFAGPTESLHPE